MKSEKDRMLTGKPYKAMDPMLLQERQNARKLIYQFNTLHPEEAGKKIDIIRSLFGKTGKSFIIETPFHCDYGYNIEIGENFYANFNCLILDSAKVTIGDNVLLAPGVSIYTAGHPVHFSLRNQEFEYAFPVVLGNNIWIGGNVVINPGITIGDNSVIGSGSVVTTDIPCNVVAAGNPCRILRQIKDEDKLYYFKKLKIE